MTDQYLIDLAQALLMLAGFFLPLAVWGMLCE